MTVTEPVRPQLSLGTAAARNLSSTTKTPPQMQEITPRWLSRMLPWVEVPGGSYRVNRRLTYTLGDGRVSFTTVGAAVRVIPNELRELPLLRDLDDEEVLSALADRFQQREYAAGETILAAGEPADRLLLIAHGKVDTVGASEYGAETVLGSLADGDHYGDAALTGPQVPWDRTVRAVTPCTVLSLPRESFQEVTVRSDVLRAHVQAVLANPRPPQNSKGEAIIAMSSGHVGEPELPGTFVDYETAPREYELSIAQTVLRVHSRVADLYNQPMNQVEQQLRLTVEALRERQESELLNNRDFGLLHNADLQQRVQTRTGPPTPDDLDELLCRRRKTAFLLAHPRAIAAFGRECNSLGLYPPTVEREGRQVQAWRGVPILPSDKIPITAGGTTSILAMRIGEESQGVIGLRPASIPDEHAPGLSVRFMGVDEQAILSYLVTAYHSAAVLVPDALGILEHVEIGR